MFLPDVVALLKLYQFYPASLNKSVVEQCLLEALASSDFHACVCLLNATLRADAKIAKVFQLSEALETASYARFWSLYREYAQRAPLLGKKAQQTILDVVGLTYQRIEKKLLSELLGANEAELAALLAARQGWTVEGELVRLPLQAKNQDLVKAKSALSTTEQKLAVLTALKN